MTRTTADPAQLRLAERATRLAGSVLADIPMEALRFSERARLRRTVNRLLAQLHTVQLRLAGFDAGKKGTAPPLRD